MPDETKNPDEHVAATSDARTTNNYGRHAYRVLTDDEKRAVSEVKDATRAFGEVLDALPPSRERSIAITKLEEASMWAVRGLTK